MESITEQTINTELCTEPVNCERIISDDLEISSFDHVPAIGENIVVKDGDISCDSINFETNDKIISNTPNTPMPVTPKHAEKKSPPILDTPKHFDEKSKLPNFLKLSFAKHNNDVFIRPSPVAEIMSPAKMLQFEIDVSTSSTPTMKRAAIDFNFFTENSFEEYFTDVPKTVNESEPETKSEAYIETPVIVKADTVRHEIGYGDSR